MSERKNDGGPAFPSQANNTDKFEGMSLRDWFAGQAIIGVLGAYADPNARSRAKANGEGATHMAEAAYVIADAMLAERAKGEANHE